jgi:uncharacterized membrane protein
MASIWAAGVFAILVLVEFVTDQLPSTPSRKVAKQVIPRIVSGGFAGAVIGAAHDAVIPSVASGIVGAIIGTFVTFEFRSRLANALGRDRPAAILEDVLALAVAGVALWTVG